MRDTITGCPERALEPPERADQERLNRLQDMRDIPAADVAPVVHGRWIEKTVPERCRYFECSNCGAHEK